MAKIGELGVRCSTTPQPKRIGANGGYSLLIDHEMAATLFYNADDALISDFESFVELEASGITRSQGDFVAISALTLANVTKPVLIVLGDHDIFSSPEDYASRFTGSGDVS